MKTYIGIVRDHSGSMSSLTDKAKDDYNQLVTDLKKNAIENEIDTIVSVIECGVRTPDGWDTKNNLVVQNSSILGVKKLDRYIANGNSTPLFDAIGQLIDVMLDVPDAKDPGVCFLINVITDGEENASKQYRHSLPETIRELQRSDRWTFAFRVPHGGRRVLEAIGVYGGNIMEWEQTSHGFSKATATQTEAIRSFYGDVAKGQTASTSFYSTDLTGVSTQKVKSALVDITGEVTLRNVGMLHSGDQIRDFVESQMGVTMKKGAAFYQLTKKEDEVQDYKQILIRDKKSGKIYGGVHSRQLLGLPFSGTVKIVPGNHGNYDIFIQSTSVNRKLVGGTMVLYWDKIGETYKNQQTPSAPAQATKQVTIPDPKQEMIRGYNDGFEDGKAKKDAVKFALAYGKEYYEGYAEGYKHGRGKKKRLYTKTDLI